MPNNQTLKLLEGAFKVQLTMNSDWHIGSGTGRPGDVDRLVRRDEDDLPFVPAKTLTGIWRDGCERAALGLDGGEIKTEIKEVEGEEKEVVIGWSAWIPCLFGDQAGQLDEDRYDLSGEETEEKKEKKKRWNQQLELPRPAMVSVRSARFPENLRDAIKGQPAVKDAVTFVKPGVAIDPRSGRAREDEGGGCLRFEEMARGGVTLTAQGNLDFSRYQHVSDEQKNAATALLLAGAKLVERIGAKRRRGAGRCQMKLEDFEVSQWLDTLDIDKPPAPPVPQKPEPFALQAKTVADEWACASLCLTAKTPLIVSEQTIGNLVKTLDYIPGTYLLPLIRRKLQAQFKDDCGVNSAIFSGQLLVTNATIALAEKPGRPVPFALFHEKVGGGLKLGRGVYNRLQEDAEGKPQLKGQRAGYIGASPSDATLLPAYKSVALAVEPHNVVEDKYQRPNEAVGGVFSYEVIPQGTELRAELRVRKSLLKNADSDWWTALNGACEIGRSKKDDYGQVGLSAAKAPCKKTEETNETETSHEGNTAGNELTVWLLSDVLLRDERLRPTASVHRLAKELGDKLGVKLAVRPDKDKEDKKMHAVSRTHRTDSWHVGWGLPRPSLVGLQAGTSVVFKADKQIEAGKLDKIAAEGIGERRAEGYGRLCFNDPLLSSTLSERERKYPKDSTEPKLAPLKKGDASEKYASTIEREAARKELQRCAMGLAANKKRREQALGIYVKIIDRQPKSEPTLSQLGTLRAALTRLKAPGDEQLLKWLEQLKAKREDRWPAGREGEEHSLHKLHNLIADEDCVWTKLQANFERLALTEEGADALKKELWAEAVRTLVDACIRAQKRDTEPKKGDSSNGAQD